MFGRRTGAIDLGQPVNRSHPLNQGLVSWWKVIPQGPYFGGSRMLDLCGVNHGTLTNGPIWSGLSHPGGRGSLLFDGTDDEVAVPFAAIGATEDVSLSLWLYPNNWTGSFTAVFDTLLGGAVRYFTLFVDLSGNIGSSQFATQPIWGSAWTGSTGMTNKSWWHLTLTRVSGVVTAYVNGVSKATSSSTNAMPATTVFFGRNASGGGSHYQGNQSDIRFARRGWSASEVVAQYQQSLAVHPGTLNYIRQRTAYFIFVGGGTTPISASDSLSISLSQTTQVDVAFTANDSASVSVSESIALSVQFTDSDTLSVAADDASELTVTFTAADTAGLTLADAATLSVAFAAAETLALALSESALVGLAISASDAVTIALIDSASVQISVGFSNTLRGQVAAQPRLAGAITASPRLGGTILVGPRLSGTITV